MLTIHSYLEWDSMAGEKGRERYWSAHTALAGPKQSTSRVERVYRLAHLPRAVACPPMTAGVAVASSFLRPAGAA